MAECRKKCREIVCTCPECQLGKDYKQRHLPKGTIESARPWDVVSIDIMGSFPYDDKAKRFIVTIMDVYSRYILAIPVGNHTAQTVSKCLYEHVVRQLKRELGDIRAKLSRILSQEKNQEKNPFSVRERVIITILPRENRNKLLAKWKGPFTITKVNTRFQIEYLENGISRTTHISYAKRFYERSLNVQTKQLCHRLSREQDIATMAHLRLVSSSGKNRRRLRAFSLAEIYRRWHYFSGPMPVRIKICGPVEELWMKQGQHRSSVEGGC